MKRLKNAFFAILTTVLCLPLGAHAGLITGVINNCNGSTDINVYGDWASNGCVAIGFRGEHDNQTGLNTLTIYTNVPDPPELSWFGIERSPTFGVGNIFDSTPGAYIETLGHQGGPNSVFPLMDALIFPAENMNNVFGSLQAFVVTDVYFTLGSYAGKGGNDSWFMTSNANCPRIEVTSNDDLVPGCGLIVNNFLEDDDDPSSVPEPETIFLLGTGLLGIGLARRKQKITRS